MLDRQDRIEQGVCIAIVAVVTMAAIASQLRGDELHDRAAAAMAIHAAGTANPWFPPVPPPAAEEPKPVARPKVFVAYAPFHCPPCIVQKRDMKDWKPEEFDVQVPDKFPIDVPFYPYTAWQDQNGKWWHLPQWVSRADLIARWKATQRPVKQARAPPAGGNGWPAMRGYQSRWTWPGDLRHHLQQTHGVGEAGRLTQDQAEALHDALHEGHSLHQIRNKFSH